MQDLSLFEKNNHVHPIKRLNALAYVDYRTLDKNHSDSKKLPVGINPLLKYAESLMALHFQIYTNQLPKNMESKAGEPLWRSCTEAITAFEVQCQRDNLRDVLTQTAKYILCAFIDEAIMRKPWAEDLNWHQKSLLSEYFNETWGGENVFKIRLHAISHISEYIWILELIYIILCLGFQGQYAIDDSGELYLSKLKHESLLAIKHYRGHFPKPSLHLSLGEKDKDTQKKPAKIKKTLSFPKLSWVIGGCALMTLTVYLSLSIALSNAEKPLIQKLQSIQKSLFLSKIQRGVKS